MRFACLMSSQIVTSDEAQVVVGAACNLKQKLDSLTHRRSGACPPKSRGCQPAPRLTHLLASSQHGIHQQPCSFSCCKAVARQLQVFIFCRRMPSSNHDHAPTAVVMRKGSGGKANSLTRRSSHQKPHTSNSLGRPTLPLSPSSQWVTSLHPGILAKITHQVRHQRDERPAQTTAARRTRPRPNYTTRLPTPAPTSGQDVPADHLSLSELVWS